MCHALFLPDSYRTFAFPRSFFSCIWTSRDRIHPRDRKLNREKPYQGNTCADFAPASEQTGTARSSHGHRSTTTESCQTTRVLTQADQRALCNLPLAGQEHRTGSVHDSGCPTYFQSKGDISTKEGHRIMYYYMFC